MFRVPENLWLTHTPLVADELLSAYSASSSVAFPYLGANSQAPSSRVATADIQRVELEIGVQCRLVWFVFRDH
jgi:hypothetical protein